MVMLYRHALYREEGAPLATTTRREMPPQNRHRSRRDHYKETCRYMGGSNHRHSGDDTEESNQGYNHCLTSARSIASRSRYRHQEQHYGNSAPRTASSRSTKRSRFEFDHTSRCSTFDHSHENQRTYGYSREKRRRHRSDSCSASYQPYEHRHSSQHRRRSYLSHDASSGRSEEIRRRHAHRHRHCYSPEPRRYVSPNRGSRYRGLLRNPPRYRRSHRPSRWRRRRSPERPGHQRRESRYSSRYRSSHARDGYYWSRERRSHCKEYTPLSQRTITAATSPKVVFEKKAAVKRDDEIVHFDWYPGLRLSRRFTVRGQLGEGTFGRVLECEDLDEGGLVAVKVVRDVSRYTSAAKIEAEILEEIKKRDPERQSNCVLLLDCFLFDSKNGRPCSVRSARHRKTSCDRSSDDDSTDSYGEGIHMCLASERLGLSLFAFLSQNNYRGYFMEDIQAITREILKALVFLHEIRLTHTDLKPENILFVNSTSEKVEFLRARHPPRFWDGDATDSDSSSVSGHPSSASRRGGGQRKRSQRVLTNRPIDCRVKLIDFGSATFEDDEHCSLINTRQYRAPEVILQTGWSMPSDVWSLGCILMELYTGVLLFRTHEHMEHLAMIERIVAPIPLSVLSVASHTDAAKYLRETSDGIRLNWPEGASSQKSLRRVRRCRPLEDMVLPCHKLFAQFVRYLLVIDPRLRPTPAEALRHRFLQETFPEH